MIIRVKEVIPSTKDGNKVRAVIKARTCKERLYEVEPSPYSVEVKAGRPPVRPAKLSAAIADASVARRNTALSANTPQMLLEIGISFEKMA